MLNQKNIHLLGVNRPSKRKKNSDFLPKIFMLPIQAALQLQEFLQPLPLLQTHGLKNVSFKQTPGQGVFEETSETPTGGKLVKVLSVKMLCHFEFAHLKKWRGWTFIA